MNRMMSRVGALTVAFVMGLTGAAFAQRTTGVVSGVVKDSSGAVLPGVTVSVTGVNVVGAQTSTTNEQGLYRILGLPPGEYQVSFSLPGFKTMTRRSVQVSLGLTVDENVTMEVSQLQEAIDVVAEAPVVDTTSNEVGSNLDRALIENAPTRRQSFFDLVGYAPGSLKTGDGNAGDRRTNVYGSSYDENAFQLDGVDITDNYFNEAQAQPSTDAIQEVEVLSLGAPAEYGNLAGAVYNIVTRQGTNEFHGDLNYFHQSNGLTSDNTKNVKFPNGSFANACASDPTKRCPWARDTYRDFSGQIGGPVVKDKLWFFGSYQYQLDSFSDFGVDPSNVLGLRKAKIDRFLSKLNWQITPKHKVVANFHLDKSAEDNGTSVNEGPTTAWTRRTKTPTPGVAYSGVLSDKTVLDVHYSGFYANVSGLPTDPNQPRDLTRFYNLDDGTITGGHYYWYDVHPKRTTATAKVSHFADDFLGGSHDFKFGVQFSTAVAAGIYGYNDLVFTYTYGGAKYGYGYERQPFSYSGNSRNVGLFADDAFRVNDRLSFNVGVRYDNNKAYSADQAELDANANPTGTRFPRTDLFTWNSVSPRVGFNLKLDKAGKTVLKGHYGRYHRTIATGEFANVVGPNVRPYFSGTFNFATNSFENTTLFSSNETLSVSPSYSSPYTDQFILSLEREIVKSLGIQVNYVHKRGRKYAAWRETAGQYARVPYTDDTGANATGNTIDIFQLTSEPDARNFEIANPDGVESNIDAVSLVLLRRMTGKWQMNTSLTWLQAKGLISGSNFGVSLQQRGGLQFRTWGRNPNDLVNGNGRLPGESEWQFKTNFLYQLPKGFQVSSSLSSYSNAWRVRRINLPEAVTGIPGSTTVLLQPRGSNSRLPHVTLLDARLQKDFELSSRAKVSFFVDGLNLLNNDAPQTVLSSLVSSSVFDYPDDFVNPRRFMLGAKLRF